jgi:hypothetical protein
MIIQPSSTGSASLITIGPKNPGTGDVYQLTPEYAIRIAGGNKVFTTPDQNDQQVYSLHHPSGKTNVTDTRAFNKNSELTQQGSGSQTLNTDNSNAIIGKAAHVDTHYDGKMSEMIIYADADKLSERSNITTDQQQAIPIV